LDAPGGRGQIKGDVDARSAFTDALTESGNKVFQVAAQICRVVADGLEVFPFAGIEALANEGRG